MNLPFRDSTRKKQVLKYALMLLIFTSLTCSSLSSESGSVIDHVTAENKFSIPEINLEEWLLNIPRCERSPSINFTKAAADILNFTKKFQVLYESEFPTFEFDELRKYSYTLNKAVDFLNKFPTFAKKIVPVLIHPRDIQFMENALDMFAVLEMKRHSMLERVFHHIEKLSSMSTMESTRRQFSALLFGFRRHIENENKYLAEFIKSIMEASSNNKIIPSRYLRGSLPGLDQLIDAFNVSTSFQIMKNNSVYQISTPNSNRMCLIRDVDGKKADILEIKRPYDNTKNCLLFRFVSYNPNNYYYIQTEEKVPKRLRLRHRTNFDVIFTSNTKTDDELARFRVVKLPNGNFLMVCRLRTRSIFLSRSEYSNRVYGNSSFCSGKEFLFEWRLKNLVT